MQVSFFTNKLSAAALTLSALVSFADQAQAITFSGNSSGQWGMPANPSSSTYISSQNGGINNRLSWGRIDGCGGGCTPFNNYVQYDGVGFNAEVGSLFNLGNLSYRNGSVWDAFDGNFPLNISLSLTNPLSNTQAFNFSFNILNTPNSTGNAVLDGDRLRFSGGLLSNNSFNYEGVNYALELVGFSTNGGTTLVNEFNSPEGSIAFASLYGKFTALTPPPQPQPQPQVEPPSQPQPQPQAQQPSQPQPQAQQPSQPQPQPQAQQPSQPQPQAQQQSEPQPQPQVEPPSEPQQPSEPKSVPEPTTLVGLTFLGLYFVNRRRQKN